LNDQEQQAMDGPADGMVLASDFRTPPRILIPKLVRSRERWKAKASERKRQYRKEQIRSRDLSLSRQRWKARALAAEQELQDVRLQHQRAEADLAQARSQIAHLQDGAKKN
jgi:hypothetical protein